MKWNKEGLLLGENLNFFPISYPINVLGCTETLTGVKKQKKNIRVKNQTGI